MLVIYYTTDLITLNKNADALKAINEYLQKSEISKICLANLYKAKAVLLMVSKENRNLNEAISLFKQAAKLYNDSEAENGAGMCYFGISKVYFDYWPELIEIEAQNSENSIFESKNKKSVKSNLENTEEKLIVNSLKYCQKALKVFGQVKWPIGEYYCSKLEDTLKRKMKRKDITPKTVKYYIDLGLLANSEKGLHKCSPFVNTEIAILLEVILSGNSIDYQVRPSTKAKGDTKIMKEKQKKPERINEDDNADFKSKHKGKLKKYEPSDKDQLSSKEINPDMQLKQQKTQNNVGYKSKKKYGIFLIM